MYHLCTGLYISLIFSFYIAILQLQISSVIKFVRILLSSAHGVDIDLAMLNYNIPKHDLHLMKLNVQKKMHQCVFVCILFT